MTLLVGTQAALVISAWIWASPWVQVGVIAGIYLLSTWYALNFIPAL